MEFYECLRRIESVIMKALGPVIHEMGFTRTEVLILMCIYHKKVSRVTDLAKMAEIPTSSFTNIVDRLVERNYVIRENDPNDRRSILLKGTPKLDETVRNLKSIGDKQIADILKVVPADIMRAATQDLNQVVEYLNRGKQDSLCL